MLKEDDENCVERFIIRRVILPNQTILGHENTISCCWSVNSFHKHFALFSFRILRQLSSGVVGIEFTGRSFRVRIRFTDQENVLVIIVWREINLVVGMNGMPMTFVHFEPDKGHVTRYDQLFTNQPVKTRDISPCGNDTQWKALHVKEELKIVTRNFRFPLNCFGHLLRNIFPLLVARWCKTVDELLLDG